jgi:hypothetical protein
MYAHVRMRMYCNWNHKKKCINQSIYGEGTRPVRNTCSLIVNWAIRLLVYETQCHSDLGNWTNCRAIVQESLFPLDLGNWRNHNWNQKINKSIYSECTIPIKSTCSLMVNWTNRVLVHETHFHPDLGNWTNCRVIVQKSLFPLDFGNSTNRNSIIPFDGWKNGRLRGRPRKFSEIILK